MKKIIFGFSKSNKWWGVYSKLICWVLDIPFSHVYMEIYWQSADEKLIYQASGLKVNFETKKHLLTHAAIVDEFELEISEETYSKISKYACEHLGDDYSILGAIGVGIIAIAKKLGFKLKNPLYSGHAGHWCSELCTELFIFINKDAPVPENSSPKDCYEFLIYLRDRNTK